MMRLNVFFLFSLCIAVSRTDAADLAVLLGKGNDRSHESVYRCTDCLKKDGFEEIRSSNNRRIEISDPRPGTIVIRNIHSEINSDLRDSLGRRGEVPVVSWVKESCINKNHRVIMDNVHISLAPGAKIENTRGGSAALVYIECADDITNSSMTSSGLIYSTDY